jgi:hypothetical protein
MNVLRLPAMWIFNRWDNVGLICSMRHMKLFFLTVGSMQKHFRALWLVFYFPVNISNNNQKTLYQPGHGDESKGNGEGKSTKITCRNATYSYFNIFTRFDQFLK